VKILIACEKSGTVRDAFIKLGHDAISCDMQPSDSDFGPHYQGDVRDLLDYPFDMMIAHPPCTHIAVSGSRHFDAWWHGEQKDPETGEHHLAHPICCGMFLWWFDKQQSGVPEAILEVQALRGASD